MALTTLSAISLRTWSPDLARNERPSSHKGCAVDEAAARGFSAETALFTDSQNGGKSGIFVGKCIMFQISLFYLTHTVEKPSFK